MISQCGFDVHFPYNYWCWAPFRTPVVHVHVFFGKYLFRSFAHFYLFLFFLNFILFCQISKWIRHRYTCVPHPEPSSLLLPIPSLWVVPVHQPQATSIMHQTWTGDSFHIWHYTCFNSCSFLLRLFLDCSQLFGSNMLQTMYFAHSSFLLIAELSE